MELYAEGLTQTEIAQRLSVSVPAVSQRLKKIGPDMSRFLTVEHQREVLAKNVNAREIFIQSLKRIEKDIKHLEKMEKGKEQTDMTERTIKEMKLKFLSEQRQHMKTMSDMNLSWNKYEQEQERDQSKQIIAYLFGMLGEADKMKARRFIEGLKGEGDG
jgi:predicted transcriptional regulator